MTLRLPRLRSIRLATLLVVATATFTPLAEVLGLLPEALAESEDDNELSPPCDCTDPSAPPGLERAGEPAPVADDDAVVPVAGFVLLAARLPRLADARESSTGVHHGTPCKPSSVSTLREDFERGPPFSA